MPRNVGNKTGNYRLDTDELDPDQIREIIRKRSTATSPESPANSTVVTMDDKAEDENSEQGALGRVLERVQEFVETPGEYIELGLPICLFFLVIFISATVLFLQYRQAFPYFNSEEFQNAPDKHPERSAEL
mmetsp:Transcript_104316/g.191074  ORF Transcript_104316/g.191074 Transcript_104316/m.191074 type:complete len:131 (-) Transcript_104316:52-444(-)